MIDQRLIYLVAKECLELGYFKGKYKCLFQHSLSQRRYYDILLNLYFNSDGVIQASSGSCIEYLRGEKLHEEKLDVTYFNEVIIKILEQWKNII